MTTEIECKDCDGTGKVERYGWLFGSLFGYKPCPTCKGVGRVPEGTQFKCDSWEGDDDTLTALAGAMPGHPSTAAFVAAAGCDHSGVEGDPDTGDTDGCDGE